MIATPGRIYFALFLCFFVAIAVIIIVFQLQKNPDAQIASFEECVKAGHPVLESYPRQCTLPGGKFFVEQTIKESR